MTCVIVLPTQYLSVSYHDSHTIVIFPASPCWDNPNLVTSSIVIADIRLTQCSSATQFLTSSSILTAL